MRHVRVFDNRLFRHDQQIVINSAAANLSGWQDRLVVGVLLCIALALARSWAQDQSWTVATRSAAAAGYVSGIWASRLLSARLAFHRTDGLLAAEALKRTPCRLYRLGWHGIGILVVAAVTLAARPAMLPFSLLAYLCGVATVDMAARHIGHVRTLPSAAGRRARRLLHAPHTGVGMATLLLLSLIPLAALAPQGQVAILGLEVVLFAAALTMIDDAVVRFECGSGHPPLRIVRRHARGLLAFAGVAIPGSWLAVGAGCATAVLLACLAMLSLLALRICAYCAYGKRLADFGITILIGVLALIGYALPLLLPVAIVAILWRLERRAAANRWLLA